MRREYKELQKTDWKKVNNKEKVNYACSENEDPRKLRPKTYGNEDPFMTLRQEACVTLCSLTEENLWNDRQPLCSQRETVWSYILNKAKAKSTTILSSRGSVIWCGNYGAQRRLSSKSLSSVWRIKCRGGENDRRVLGIQCGRVKFFLCGRDASTKWWRQRKEKSS